MATAPVENLSNTVPSQPPDLAQMVMRMCSGYMISAALYPVTKLGVADLLADQSPQSVDKLAAQTEANEDGLYRVMRALATVGIFEEVTPRTFALTPAANLLRKNVPRSMRDMVLWMTNEFHFRTWGQLMHSVKTGSPSVEAVYGKACFELFPEHPEINHEFNNAMTNISAMTVPVVLENYDFSGINTLVDVGGGHGLLISQILKHYPDLHGCIFDLTHVCEGASERIERLRLGDRLRTVSGNFFESVCDSGDAYIMQHVLHDWPDEQCVTILKNVRKALQGKPNGKLIVLDALVTSDDGFDFKKWLDLEMLMMPGGRERTQEEFRTLLEKSGFKLTRVISLPSMVSILEAEPA